jgi:hydrogenase expression/formation protein HypD
VNIDGLILPGHVTAVTGTAVFDFVHSEFHIPCVVSGFEPADLMETILMLCRQFKSERADVENQYTRVVRQKGNPHAKALIEKMFEPCDMPWRGFGDIPQSGLAIRDEFSAWDAANISVEVETSREHPGCRCGEVLRGMIKPQECALFGKSCTPENPRGACMVSSEGACAAVYHFAAETA